MSIIHRQESLRVSLVTGQPRQSSGLSHESLKWTVLETVGWVASTGKSNSIIVAFDVNLTWSWRDSVIQEKIWEKKKASLKCMFICKVNLFSGEEVAMFPATFCSLCYCIVNPASGLGVRKKFREEKQGEAVSEQRARLILKQKDMFIKCLVCPNI